MSNPHGETIQATVAQLIEQEHLPADFADTAMAYYVPLAEYLQCCQAQAGRPLVVGINGAQGTGKSTLALFLETLLTTHFQCPCARISIDDIYLTRAEREALAAEVHPLLLTRGVPGTHDVALGQRLLDQLLAAEADDVVPIPRFDKARDDRAPPQEWPLHRGRVAVVLLEGWCVGAVPQAADALTEPVNSLEAQEDQQGIWRGYVNQHLEGEYQRLFQRLDTLVMLKAPSLECVLEWRTLQEQKLRERIGLHQGGAGESRIMSPEQIKRFIMHYERLTRALLAEMPQRADVVFNVAEDHQIREVRYRD